MKERYHVSQARFIVCPRCGLHGHYVLADGQELEEVNSQSQAIRQLQELIAAGQVDSSDAMRLIREVKGSSLMVNPPANPDEVIKALMQSPIGTLVVLTLVAELVNGRPSDMARRMGAFSG